MRKENFRQCLNGKIRKELIGNYICRYATVKYFLKIGLGQKYKKNNGQTVITNLRYNAQDRKSNFPVPTEFNFKERCYVIQRLTNFRLSIN